MLQAISMVWASSCSTHICDNVGKVFVDLRPINETNMNVSIKYWNMRIVKLQVYVCMKSILIDITTVAHFWSIDFLTSDMAPAHHSSQYVLQNRMLLHFLCL